MAIAVAGLLLLAASAKAAYTPGTPIPTYGKVTSVAVNQASRDLYAASFVGPQGIIELTTPDLPG
ncbi:MAG TPA: hypothetical protein VFY04_01245, partial [Solirubrobacterales bacterium]|nr:hypothetical protein [Solirubrobacterales bacterium]